MAFSSSEIRLTSGQQKSLIQIRNSITRLRQDRGRELYRSNGTLSLKENEPPMPGHREFAIVVRGSRRYEVFIHFAGDRAEADCYCEDNEPCKHIYCAIQSLLSRAEVQESGKKIEAQSFVAELEKALERSLQSQEHDYLSRIREAYACIQDKSEITVWDLRGLLPAQFGGGGTRVELWPEPPESIEEFWLYVGHAIQSKGLHFPSFMQPVSDFSLIAGKVRDWLRQQEIENWSRRFSNLEEHPPAVPEQALELRLRFETDKFLLESSLGGPDGFAPIKPSRVRQLAGEIEADLYLLSDATRIIWRSFGPSLAANPFFSYQDTAAVSALDDLLRMPVVRPNLAAIDGEPLEFATDPLRWQITETTDLAGDFELQFVTAAGTPPLRILTRFPGNPALYLTAKTLYQGPPVQVGFSISEKIRIPGEVVDSPVGIHGLIRLDAPLPARVRDRVRRVPLHLRLKAALEKPRHNDSEFVQIEVQSADDRGREIARFAEDEWLPINKKAAKPATDPAIIEVPDYSRLAGIGPILESLPAGFDRELNRWTCKVTRKFPDQFATWLLALPVSVELILDKELDSFRERPLTARFDLEVEEAGVDWFDLRSTLKIEDTSLTKEEISLLLKAGGQYVRLGAKGWRKLAFELSPEDQEALARLGLSPEDLNGEPQRMHVLQLAHGKSRRLLDAGMAGRIELRAAELKMAVTPEIPAVIQASLRPYQISGFHFLAYLSENNFGGILADDMGLGKTLQTLAWLAWLREKPANFARTVLVVCPKSVTDNWLSETARFYPGLRVGIWREKKTALFAAFVKEHDVVVLNYSQLRACEEALQAVQWLAVILDEGQFIKNPTSQTAQAARSLRADHRLILTGTPIENRLLDLWSLMSFAMPGILGKQARFQVLFNEKKDPLATRRLSARVHPFLLRRSKKEVATDLPDRVEEDLICEMEGAQLTRYRAELKLARQHLLKIQTSKQLDKERFSILTSLLRLRQICAHPGLADTKLTDSTSAKQEALFDLLEPLIEEGHKVLVFSQFVSMLDRLQLAINERQWQSFYLAGDTEDRGELVQTFQNHPGSAVFLISLRAGGFGLNLTSASYVVLYDPWWNPAVENQAIDRTHRIGQVNKVIAYRLITKDSIEEKIRALQKSKGALAEDILGEENFVRALTLDDFRYLFDDV